MKEHSKTLILALALSGSALTLTAQDTGTPSPGGVPPTNEGAPAGPPGPGGPGAPGRMHRRPPPSPLMLALDTNGDGILDEQEIANAPAALLKLDKNGDGRLTPDELRPPFPPPCERGPDAAAGRGGLGGTEVRPSPNDQQGGDGRQLPPRPARPPRPPQPQPPSGDQ